MILVALIGMILMALVIGWRAHRYREQVMEATSDPRAVREYLRHRRYRIDP